MYNQHDLPTEAEKAAMWSQIQRESGLFPALTAVPAIHWRSFVFGSAASLLFMLAAYGAFQLVSTLSGNDRRSLDSAYSEAMNRLLDAAPQTTQLASENGKQALQARIQGIEDLDNMIEEIRNDMLLSGPTEIKKKQLRSLYAMKMDMVKELVLEGEINL